MVRDVANASREQMAGITQINDAVAQLDQMTQQNAKLATNISAVGDQIYEQTENFNTIINRVEFDPKYHQSSSDIDLLFDSSRLKLDHVSFKENNYAKISTASTTWAVTSHTDCNLGKWIKQHENESFAHTEEWKKLLDDHEKVHTCTQKFINTTLQHDNSQQTVQSLQRIGEEIERATKGVFDGLDGIKKAKHLG
jgi:methyl-accepting chemotaxis protein